MKTSSSKCCLASFRLWFLALSNLCSELHLEAEHRERFIITVVSQRGRLVWRQVPQSTSSNTDTDADADADMGADTTQELCWLVSPQTVLLLTVIRTEISFAGSAGCRTELLVWDSSHSGCLVVSGRYIRATSTLGPRTSIYRRL